MEDKHRIDPLTGEEFEPKRINQRFAKPANRIKYNNLKASKLRQERAFFDKPCQRSHSVFKSLYDPESDNIHHKQFLMGKGADFTAWNHLVDTLDYKNLPAYYDYAIRRIPGTDNYEIIKL